MATTSGVAVGSDSNGSYYRPPRSARKIRTKGIEPVYKSSMVSSPASLQRDYHYRDPTFEFSQSYEIYGVGDSLHGQAHNTFVGTTNPYWRDQIRSGGSAVTPAQGVMHELDNSWYNCSVSAFFPQVDHSAQETTSGYPPLDYPYPIGISPDMLVNVTNRAITKFLNAAEAIQSSIEAGQDLGEHKETINGLRSPLSSLRQHVLGYFPKVRKLGKGKRKGRIAMEKALADTYLEFQFGWKPLARDIADAYVGLTDNQHFKVYPVKATAGVDYYGYQNTPENPIFGSGFYKPLITATSTSSYVIRFKGAVWSKADPDGRIGTAQALQLDLPHFIPTVWDLLPYSFIIDYFTNVGDIIRAASFVTAGVRWVNRTDRQIDRINFSANEVLLSTEGITGFRPSGWQARVARVAFSRNDVSPGTLVPSLAFSLPHSSKPWENIAAIIMSRALPVSRLLSKFL
jgi:hypothetical protein